MAVYQASCRTNYFNVIDYSRFIKTMERVPQIKVVNKDGRVAILGNHSGGGGWPTFGLHAEPIDLPKLIAGFLAPGSVAIFMEVGAEGLNYLVGFAEAINSQGQRRKVDLSQIYALAKELTDKDVSEVAF